VRLLFLFFLQAEIRTFNNDKNLFIFLKEGYLAGLTALAIVSQDGIRTPLL
jgi:hypothetical protein